MSTPTDQLYDKAANGDRSAREYLELWNRYCHAVDDLVDAPERPSPESLLDVFVQAAVLYSHDFHRRHASTLLPVVMLVTSAYADSVKCERKEGWAGALADVLRFSGNEMVKAVAMLTGGYPLVRDLSPVLWAVSYGEHHDAEGRPT